MGAFVILLLMLVPGLWLYSFVSEEAKSSFTFSEKLSIIIGTSIVVTTIVLIALIMLNLFNLTAIAIIYGLLLAVFLVKHKKNLNLKSIWPGELIRKDKLLIALSVIIIVVSTVLFFQPTQYLVGGRDPGVYVNTAFEISLHNQIKKTDTLLTEANRDYPNVFEVKSIKFLGFYTELNNDEIVINPQFYHGYTVWLGISHKLFGTDKFLYINPFLALISLLIFYVAVKELFNKWVGIVSVLLITLNISQIWYARSPYTEIMSQLFLWFSIYLVIKAYKSKDNILGFLSGLCMGVAILVRLDSIFYLPAAVIFLIYVFLKYKKDTGWAYRTIYGFITAAVITFGYIMKFGTRYTQNQLIEGTPIPDYVTIPVLFAAMIILGLLFVLIIYLLRKPFTKLINWLTARKSLITTVFSVFTALAFVYLYFVRPLAPNPHLTYIGTRSFREESLVRLGWFITRMGIFFSMGGFIYFIKSKLRKEHIMFLLLILSNFTLYLYNPRIFPDQFWAVRRHVPFIIPTLIVFIAFGAYELGRIKIRFLRPWLVTGIIALYFCGKFTLAASPFLFHTEYEGVIDGLYRLADRFEKDAIIVATDKDYTARLVGTPLEYLFNRNVLVLKGTVDQENLYRYMRDKESQGHPVYLLTGNGNQNLHNPYMSYNYLDEENIMMRMAIPSELSRPDKVIQNNLRYYIYKPTFGVALRNEVTIDIGSPQDINYGLVGFFDFEDNGKYNYRWAQGESSMRIVLDPNALRTKEKCTLSLNGVRLMPEGSYDSSLYITINGELIGSMPITAAMTPHKLDFPSSLIKEDGELLIEFKTKAFIPSQLGISADLRELGFILDSLNIQ